MAWPIWLLALALLLKAGVPMLASLAADLQGKTLFEVCTVYGVRTVAVDSGGKGDSAPADGASAHGGDVCVLSGLLGLPAPLSGALIALAMAAAAAVLIVAARLALLRIDAAARWLAGCIHGPPAPR